MGASVGSADLSDGTFDVLVVFAGFDDAPHDETFLASARQPYLEAVEAYVEAQSFGQLDVVFTEVPGWVTIGERHEDYLTTSAHPVVGRRHLSGYTEWRAVVEVAALVDVTNGGERFDSLLLVTPPSHFHGGLASPTPVPTDQRPRRFVPDDGSVTLLPAGEPSIRSAAHVGTFVRERPTPDAEFPAFITAHELLHNLGLNDLYAYDKTREFAPPPGREADYVKATFGRMGLGVWWPRAPGTPADQPVPDPGYPASGSVPTEATVVEPVHPSASEKLGWSRWRLGWLEETHVACLEPGTSTVELAPVAAPGSGTALVVMPLTSRLLVLEARRRIGYDADLPARGDSQYVRHLPDEGVLAYLVDPRRRSGSVPLVLLGDDGAGLASGSPILTAGETVTLSSGDRGHSVTVTVAKDDGTNFEIDIDWRRGTNLAVNALDFDTSRSELP